MSKEEHQSPFNKSSKWQFPKEKRFGNARMNWLEQIYHSGEDWRSAYKGWKEKKQKSGRPQNQKPDPLPKEIEAYFSQMGREDADTKKTTTQNVEAYLERMHQHSNSQFVIHDGKFQVHHQPSPNRFTSTSIFSHSKSEKGSKHQKRLWTNKKIWQTPEKKSAKEWPDLHLELQVVSQVIREGIIMAIHEEADSVEVRCIEKNPTVEVKDFLYDLKHFRIIEDRLAVGLPVRIMISEYVAPKDPSYTVFSIEPTILPNEQETFGQLLKDVSLDFMDEMNIED